MAITTLVADLGEHEGIFVPWDEKYWFEAGDHRVKNEMIFYDEKKQPAKVEVYRPEGVLIAGNVKLGVSQKGSALHHRQSFYRQADVEILAQAAA